MQTDPSQSDSKDLSCELAIALSGFENSILAPPLSGQLPAWLDAVKKAWEGLSSRLDFHVKNLHPQQYETISKQDSELISRVQQLQLEDKALGQQCDQLARLIAGLERQLSEIEPDEDRVHTPVKNIVDEGTALLIRVRKQEIAIQTWYVEAFNRDGGAVD